MKGVLNLNSTIYERKCDSEDHLETRLSMENCCLFLVLLFLPTPSDLAELCAPWHSSLSGDISRIRVDNCKFPQLESLSTTNYSTYPEIPAPTQTHQPLIYPFVFLVLTFGPHVPSMSSIPIKFSLFWQRLFFSKNNLHYRM